MKIEEEIKLLAKEIMRLGKKNDDGRYSVKFGVIVRALLTRSRTNSQSTFLKPSTGLYALPRNERL